MSGNNRPFSSYGGHLVFQAKMAFLKWQVLRLWLKTCQGVEQYWWNLAVMSMNDHRCHFIHLIVMVMSISLIIHAWWHNDKNHKRLKKSNMSRYFSVTLIEVMYHDKKLHMTKVGILTIPWLYVFEVEEFIFDIRFQIWQSPH